MTLCFEALIQCRNCLLARCSRKLQFPCFPLSTHTASNILQRRPGTKLLRYQEHALEE
ncbi:hypothetical protein CHS0354_033587, partial [Potamilus streckersoni]